MDSLRGNGEFRDAGDWHDDDLAGYGQNHGDEGDLAPLAIGQDERRMQVRAYNFWASLLDGRRFPAPDAIQAADRPDFADNAVLLKFDGAIDNPAVAFLGDALASECEAPHEIARLADIPGRSLLSRITDHYLQIIANAAPIGFEAEFTTQRGVTVLYRGILLPFSSDDETIDHIYGVINWKEVADQQTTDGLLAEFGAARETAPRRPELPLTEWADGPVALPGASSGDETASDPFAVPLFGEDEGGDPAPGALADWLEVARASAAHAHSSEDRSRSALYAAIGRAWDFALASRNAPEEFVVLLREAGLRQQERAPMTPVVKLVFGADYDKTRLTEYAAALLHAERMGLGRGDLGPFLAEAPGGLKGVVAAERRLRRNEAERDAQPRDPVFARRLRELPERPIEALPLDGAEFALVFVRRTPDRKLSLIGEIADDAGLIERAARHLLT